VIWGFVGFWVNSRVFCFFWRISGEFFVFGWDLKSNSAWFVVSNKMVRGILHSAVVIPIPTSLCRGPFSSELLLGFLYCVCGISVYDFLKLDII
jgi:hypothetical protein